MSSLLISYTVCLQSKILKMRIWNTKEREIEVDGFKVEVHNFGYASFYYPSHNTNAEFKVSSKGFKDLRRYLRTIKWLQRQESIFTFPNTPLGSIK